MRNVLPTTYHTHITSERKWLDFRLNEVWQYRDLIILFTKRSFAVMYKQTVLGPAWILLNPLLSSLMYAFVFGGIAGIGTNGVPQILFYLCSTAAWNLFATSLNKNATTFVTNANVFGKVYFPRLTVPISNVLSALIQFGVQMLLVLAVFIFYLCRGEVEPQWGAWLLIPVVLVQIGMLGMGFGIIVSSLTTKYRDLSLLVSFGVQLWMYITPIVYPLSELTAPWMRMVLMINPMTLPVELLRYAILGRGVIDWGFYGLSWGITICVMVFGTMIFNRVEKTFMDTV